MARLSVQVTSEAYVHVSVNGANIKLNVDGTGAKQIKKGTVNQLVWSAAGSPGEEVQIELECPEGFEIQMELGKNPEKSAIPTSAFQAHGVMEFKMESKKS